MSHRWTCDKGNRERLRLEDAMLPLKPEERPRDKGHRWPIEAGKGKEANSPLEPPEGPWLC